ncbi:MAG: glycosyl hydrolase family 2, partial [Limosilactobacillus fermentum]
MEAELKWLDDSEVFRVNQLPAHSDHRFYRDQEEAALEKSSYVQ